MLKILLFIAMLISPFASFAADESSIFLNDSEIEQHKATIKKLEDYLTNQTTITSDFTQSAPDGSISSGKFYLERPNKMRWEYNPPVPILMVANGLELVYYDKELQQVTYIPMISSLSGFLARETIKFDGEGVGITSFSESAGFIRVGIAQKDKPSDGNLVLEFSDKPMVLRSMVIVDSSGQTTNVSLNNANFGKKLDQKLFDFRDPRKKSGF